MYNVKMDIAEDPKNYGGRDESEVAEQRFQERYLRPLGDDVRYVRLGSGFRLKWQGYILTFFDRYEHAR